MAVFVSIVFDELLEKSAPTLLNIHLTLIGGAMKLILRRVTNSLIWMVSGFLVITIRAVILQSSYIFAWELLGGGMVAYGTAKLLWALARGAPKESSIA